MVKTSASVLKTTLFCLAVCTASKCVDGTVTLYITFYFCLSYTTLKETMYKCYSVYLSDEKCVMCRPWKRGLCLHREAAMYTRPLRSQGRLSSAGKVFILPLL